MNDLMIAWMRDGVAKKGESFLAWIVAAFGIICNNNAIKIDTQISSGHPHTHTMYDNSITL